MLIAADDALRSAADTAFLDTIPTVDRKFGHAIDLLSDFAKGFPLKNLTSDPNSGREVSGDVMINVKSKSPSTILHALKNDLHSNVTFPSVLYLPTLTNCSQWAMNYILEC